jgi:hypothetical protein
MCVIDIYISTCVEDTAVLSAPGAPSGAPGPPGTVPPTDWTCVHTGSSCGANFITHDHQSCVNVFIQILCTHPVRDRFVATAPPAVTAPSWLLCSHGITTGDRLMCLGLSGFCCTNYRPCIHHFQPMRTKCFCVSLQVQISLEKFQSRLIWWYSDQITRRTERKLTTDRIAAQTIPAQFVLHSVRVSSDQAKERGRWKFITCRRAGQHRETCGQTGSQT